MKIAQALIEKKKISGIRMLERRSSLYSATTPYTLMGKGWTLYFAITHEADIVGMRLVGNRDRFEEDFILAKLTVS
jgi:hypothetical protein